MKRPVAILAALLLLASSALPASADVPMLGGRFSWGWWPSACVPATGATTWVTNLSTVPVLAVMTTRGEGYAYAEPTTFVLAVGERRAVPVASVGTGPGVFAARLSANLTPTTTGDAVGLGLEVYVNPSDPRCATP